MKWPFLQKDRLFHVGLLMEGAARKSGSLEAFCLSVSEDPMDWRRIASLGDAPEWCLTRDHSLFLDVLALTSSHEVEIASWAIRAGHACEANLWKAWFTDEDGQWSYMILGSREAALNELGDLDHEDLDGPAPDGSCIEPFRDIILTPSGLGLLENWSDPLWGLDGATILYAREVLSIEHSDLVGLWWEEEYDPSCLSCPRGGIFPERLREFECSMSMDPGTPTP